MILSNEQKLHNYSVESTYIVHTKDGLNKKTKYCTNNFGSSAQKNL